MSTVKSVGILLFDNVEVLDYCGPFEVFSCTVDNDNNQLFQVHLIAESTERPITTIGGMRVLPDVSYDNCPPLDIFLVPGGNGTRPQMVNAATLEFVQRQAKQVSLLASVCTGSLILAKAGNLLEGKTVTTHWEALDLLDDESLESCTVDRTRHWIKDGNLYTSAGISAGVDMALKIVEDSCGESVARTAARNMEFRYPETDERRIDL